MMKKEYEICIRDKQGKVVLHLIASDDCVISIIENDYPSELEGWKRHHHVWDNLSIEEKNRMLEHSTSLNNEDKL